MYLYTTKTDSSHRIADGVLMGLELGGNWVRFTHATPIACPPSVPYQKLLVPSIEWLQLNQQIFNSSHCHPHVLTFPFRWSEEKWAQTAECRVVWCSALIGGALCGCPIKDSRVHRWVSDDRIYRKIPGAQLKLSRQASGASSGVSMRSSHSHRVHFLAKRKRRSMQQCALGECPVNGGATNKYPSTFNCFLFSFLPAVDLSVGLAATFHCQR